MSWAAPDIDGGRNVYLRIYGILAGTALLLALELGTLSRLPPTVNPYSLVAAIPIITIFEVLQGDRGAMFFVLGICGTLIAPVAFVLLSRLIVKSEQPLPKVSVILFLIVAISSFVFAVRGWDATVRFTSIYRALALGIQCLVPPTILIVITVVKRGRFTLGGSLAMHWFALAWFTWSAFPWWGEGL